MKKFCFCLLLLSATFSLRADDSTLTPLKFSVLGDSYSTYAGYVHPEWNAVWYFDGMDEAYNHNNDLTSVEQTWWRLLDANPAYQLDTNNSFSGATVCTTGYNGADYSDRAFVTRVYDMGDPDIIFVFGGTNDSWAKAPIGEYQYGDWKKEDLKAYRPAMACMMAQLQSLYPKARIINILNSELDDAINESTQTICDHYGITNITLHDIEKGWGHPSVAGMQAIYSAVLESLEANK